MQTKFGFRVIAFAARDLRASRRLPASVASHSDKCRVPAQGPLCAELVLILPQEVRLISSMTTLGELRRVLGKPPHTVPLAPKTVETVDCGEFHRCKIQYDVEHEQRISAYLLVPHGATRAPAVFCHHQHAGQYHLGKSEIVGLAGDPDQALGPELARRGFIVLAPDALGFEERNWSDQPGFAQYHELTTRIVQGRTMLSKVIHDVSVGVTFLEQHESVDPARIGFIGHSYGGRMAIWASAFDKRIRAAVSNCGCVGYEASMERTIGIQAEFCVPGIAAVADTVDVARSVAPRALYISAASEDKYSRGAATLSDALRESFPPAAFEVKIWDGGHEFTKPMRERSYQFLEKHLADDAKST